jgi:zinc transport system substrate-binding protein
MTKRDRKGGFRRHPQACPDTKGFMLASRPAMIAGVMSRTPYRCATAIAALFLLFKMVTPVPASAAPKVVTSILPIHSLVSAVMEGVGRPTLLIDRPVSPHSYSLRPSDAKAINGADLVVWIGPTLESFLIKPLSTLPTTTRVITLTNEPTIKVIHVTDASGPAELGRVAGLDIDPHIWLDPDNAMAIVRIVRDALKKLDPAHAGTYDANAEREIDDLVDLDMSTLDMTAGNFIGRPVILYHDSLRYFAKRYGLEIAGTVLSGDKLPGARHMSQLRKLISEKNVRCVFTEPEFSPAMAQSLVEGTKARVATIDPLGTKIQPGVNAYRFLIEGVFGGLLACLRD